MAKRRGHKLMIKGGGAKSSHKKGGRKRGRKGRGKRGRK